MSVNACGRNPSLLRSLLGRSSGLMVLLSVILHGAIAFFPVREAPELPEQTISESLPPITVTRLPEHSDVAVSDGAAVVDGVVVDDAPAQPIAPPQVIMPQPAPQSVISQLVVPEPEPLPVIAEPPVDTSVENVLDESMPDENTVDGNEEDELRSSGGGSSPSPQFNETEIAAMAAVWEGFLGGLQGGLSGSNLQQILSVFGQPEQEELFFDANQQPKVSVVSHHLLEEKTPEQVFEEVVNPALNEQEGFEVREYGEFAGGPVYEVMQGEIVHYLNIVPLSVDSVLLVCDRPPGA